MDYRKLATDLASEQARDAAAAYLLSAAKEARVYLACRIKGTAPKGLYDDIFCARLLDGAIEAVEACHLAAIRKADQG